MFDVQTIEKKIGYSFENKSLLKLAFTHSSYANENKAASNEKLEFLGDSILNFCIAEHLFRKGGGNEGTLTVMSSKIVSEPPLARCVDGLDIIGHLICGVGESNNHNKSDAVKADLFEAIIGAVYLDSNDIFVCQSFILKHLESAVNDALDGKKPLKYTFRIIEKKPKSATAERGDNPDGKPDKKPAAAQGKRTRSAPQPQTQQAQPETQQQPGQQKLSRAELKRLKQEQKEKAKREKLEKKGKEKQSKRENKTADIKKTESVKPPEQAQKDYKSLLQNYFQAQKKPKPEYVVTGQAGSQHEPIFNVEVRAQGQFLGDGAGGRKKDAEQAAAKEACIKLNIN